MGRIDDQEETGRGHAPPGLSYPAQGHGTAQRPDHGPNRAPDRGPDLSPDDDPTPPPDRGAVVLLHGFMGAPWTMRAMGRALRAQGFRPFCPWYESWAAPFDTIVARVAAALEKRGIGHAGPVHFVGHSMGGLIARSVVERLQPAGMGHMVMIGTPNGGSELADFCTGQRLLRPLLGRAGPALVTQRRLPALDGLDLPTYPVGVIAGDSPLPTPLRVMPHPHDGKVSVASTHLAGEADHVTLPVSHAIMPFSPAVQRQTAHFLTDGRFLR
ncbi:alpha/beta fold hydrolase [Sphingobium sufflavum]|uniref:alpha/beta fold hydrolase n=1 Tax=Sphingobium sufflavum TaxID=1129547 RepID=UPI001F2F6EF7|nr:alpha/beta fold hydrolase [Sphingobium sufflavum]MCE7796086.1 alpha/beta fold hydrolase [Sphingobium sufflavum]